MTSGVKLEELSKGLSAGFFTDQVVMALARAQRIGCLQEKDRSLIGKAVSLLHQVLEGANLLDELIGGKGFRANSGESAQSFNRAVQAVHAITPSARSSREFAQYINKLIGIAHSLLEKDTAEHDAIQLLRNFFSNYGMIISNETQRALGR